MTGPAPTRRPLRWLNQPLGGALVCLALIGISALVGCKRWDPGFDDQFAGEARQLRPKSDSPSSARKMGLSSRSRQIEEDLGVR